MNSSAKMIAVINAAQRWAKAREAWDARKTKLAWVEGIEEDVDFRYAIEKIVERL